MQFFSRKWGFPALLVLAIMGLRLWAFAATQRDDPAAREQAKALADVRVLTEKGAYPEAIAHLRDEFSHGDLSPSERLRASRVLDYLLLCANRIEEATENAKASYSLALERGLSTEADAFEAELALLQAYRKGLAQRASRDIPSSNLQFAEADRLAVVLESLPYQMKIADAWSLNYLNSKDDPERFLALSLRALNLAVSLGYKTEASRAANKVGTYYLLKSDYSKALSYYLKALNALDTTREADGVVACLNNIAAAYASLGDYVKAKDYLLEAASRIPKNARRASEDSLLLSLGDLFGGLGKRSRSESLRAKALDCFDAYLRLQGAKRGDGLRLEALAGKADIFLDQGRLEEAGKMLASAIDEARSSKVNPLVLGRILTSTGEWALRTGAVGQAERYFEEVRSLAERTGNPVLTNNAAFGLGRCAEARGDIDRAIESYDLALDIVGEGFSGIVGDVHRSEFIGRGLEPFQALVRLFLRLSKGGEAGAYEREIFRLSESVRARSFLEFQERLSRKPPGAVPAAEGAAEAGLKRERIGLLKALSRNGLGQAERERLGARIVQIDDSLDASIFDRYGAGSGPAPSPKPIPLGVLQSRVLDGRTAVLEYLLGEPRSVLFCISKSSFDLVELPAAPEIADALTGFLSFLEDPSLPPAKGLPAAARLYRILMAPAETLLPAEVDRLIIVPDGLLSRLPFEALVSSTTDAPEPVYVNDRFTVSYAPSASSLGLAGAKPAAPYAKSALAFGVTKRSPAVRLDEVSTVVSAGAVLDDVYGRRGFSADPLTHVADEIADLRRRIEPGLIDVYQGRAATERALKMLDLEDYRLIHLACHAFSDDERPLRSALLLSPGAGDEEDGYLQVSEMYDLRTNADLVVLSACQTGRGTTVMNEGSLGLPRVFFYMGAKSVLSTLWPINDKSGAVFMKVFYDAYFRGDGKAGALRAAKSAMRRTRFAHPFFWASYVLTGEF